MFDSTIFLRSYTDTAHYLTYTNAIDGFQLTGNSGGQIGTPVFPNGIKITSINAVNEINLNFTTKINSPVTLGAAGSVCNGMQFGRSEGSATGNGPVDVIYPRPFNGAGPVPHVILTVASDNISLPTGNAHVTNESHVGFRFHYSVITSAGTFTASAAQVAINWMALQ